LEEGRMCAERLRVALASCRFPHLPHGAIITASFGVAELRAGEAWASLFKRTDTCLYAAKNSGRNRTVTAVNEEGSVVCT
jgi:PleD family two-component response regulator